MSRNNLKIFVVTLALVPALTACAPYQYRGGMAGGAMGGFAGAILDSRNPWRGGVVGATIGAIAGATIAEISAQGAQEAAYADRPVEYRTNDGRGYYYAEPIGHDRREVRIRERYYEDGRLVREQVKIIRTEPGHARHDRDYRDYRDDD